jgi:rubrerythrin
MTAQPDNAALIAKLRRAEERAQAAERERDRAKFLMECADTPLMRDVMTSRDAAEAQVRELREALTDSVRACPECKGSGFVYGSPGPKECPTCAANRAVLAHSAGRDSE